MSVESQRQLLETLNVLEVAIAQRFRTNPELRGAAGLEETDPLLEAKRKRSRKETLSQQHELAYFKEQYFKTVSRIEAAFAGVGLEKEFMALADPKMKFEALLSTIRDIDNKYENNPPTNATSALQGYLMYSSAPEDDHARKRSKVKRKHFLSSATEFIEPKLSLAFNESEMYGKYIDLTLFHDMYNRLTGSHSTYLEYLQSFVDFKGTSTSPEYRKYLQSLLLFLQNFLSNAYPLNKAPALTNIEDCSDEPKPKDDLFCEPCNKLFAKESVFKSHLDGKKHKRNVATAQEKEGKKSTNSHDKAESIKVLENKIRLVAKSLHPVINSTITDYEPMSRLSEREKLLDRIAVEGNPSDYTDIDSDSEKESPSRSDDEDDDLDDAYAKDLPIDTDGLPIPLWLYKLQGLHKSYSCEICGNSTYKGRQQFNKHFISPKHVHGLLCLGVDEQDTSKFTNISQISEAQALLAKINQSKQTEEEKKGNIVELEDEDGNVMSQKDYIELKRQGLI